MSETGRKTNLAAPAAAFLVLWLCLCGAAEVRAQWTSGGGNTTTTDNVGVGTANPPQATLHVQRNVDGDAKLLLLNAGTGANSRSIFLLGEAASDARYGYLAYFGANNQASLNGQGLANSTALVNAGGGGLRLFSLGGQYSTGGAITFSTAPAAAGGGNDAAAERMRINSNGNVGIGTANPDSPLTVTSSTNVTPLKVSGTHPIVIGYVVQNLRPGSKGWAFQVAGDQHPDGVTNGSFIFRQATDDINAMVISAAGSVGVGTNSPAAGYKLDVAGAANVGGNLNVTGNIMGANIQATYQDVAEWVPSVQKLSAGTVVVLDAERTNHVIASSSAYDTKVAGVVSEQPGVILGTGGEGKLKVATTGRVKVKADATRGAILVGDLLVTSGVEGVAMKSVPVDLGGTSIHRPGTIIGKALEPLESGTGVILVLLSLQ